MRSTPSIHLRSDQRPDTWIVIPCYNEEQRLDAACFVEFARSRPWVGLLFVNDGSQDRTLELIDSLVQRLGNQGGRIDLEENRGKAEAVRRGLSFAMRSDALYVGYWDADLATPLQAVDQFRTTLQSRGELELVAGTRMPLMGRNITRHPVRARIGRCFAVVASQVMRFRMWDTQCGAKLFRVSPLTRAAFASNFYSSWIFDVEVLSRLATLLGKGSSVPRDRHRLQDVVYELPLDRWSEIPGSKVKGRDFAKAAYELTVLFWIYRVGRWQARLSQATTSESTVGLLGGLLTGTANETNKDQPAKAA